MDNIDSIMANSTATYTEGTLSLPIGFSLLFTTDEISADLGEIFTIAGKSITHQYSGGATSFVFDGLTLSYNGEIASNGRTTVAIIFDASLSTLRLLVGGTLEDTVPCTTGAISGSNTVLTGSKPWNISDFRLYNKGLSDGAVNYYHLDASSTGLGVGRLG